jgi:hypothetical protein
MWTRNGPFFASRVLEHGKKVIDVVPSIGPT